jgi:hypothetical protein
MGASLIVITPNAGVGWVAPLLQLINNGITPTALLFDPSDFGGDTSIKDVAHLLASRGISHAALPPALFERPEARPGKQGEWEWEVVAPGKIVPIHRPAKSEWRPLA